MQKLIVFNHVSLDGFFVDGNGRMDWAKMGQRDAEWDAFVAENASGDGALVFGRVTYELMNSYWPTPMARQHDAIVADRMNDMKKIVFSRTLDNATWNNTTVIKDDLAGAMRKMKQESPIGLTILGSGTIISQLAPEGLIDEYQMVMNPVILGAGRTMFDGVKRRLDLKLDHWRAFKNGCVFLKYVAA